EMPQTTQSASWWLEWRCTTGQALHWPRAQLWARSVYGLSAPPSGTPCMAPCPAPSEWVRLVSPRSQPTRRPLACSGPSVKVTPICARRGFALVTTCSAIWWCWSRQLACSEQAPAGRMSLSRRSWLGWRCKGRQLLSGDPLANCASQSAFLLSEGVMSALGQKQRSGTSTQCPPYPQTRTCAAQNRMSARGRRELSQVGLHALKPCADPCLELCVYYWAVLWGGLKVDGPDDNTKTVEGFENLDGSPV